MIMKYKAMIYQIWYFADTQRMITEAVCVPRQTDPNLEVSKVHAAPVSRGTQR